ncbi:hypothetical protein [Solirubrum puertoriconensis]|uniref:Uncharacterized protein n=1 Tax=Solirubrum puertoriconensis TaxID=1751427 RepID=A0A9X0L687_SOLP1|nr:hypothetical protein [Solirubrum puertoriconensis]KUG09533.1 hypothetical protein ASU33_17640 [Solirubrum puertoriconensis]
MVSVTIYYWVFPDIMPYNGGFGFEGFTIYKPLAKDVNQYLFIEKMNSYSIQRIFPYVLLYGFFKLFNIEFSDFNMLLFFQIFQFVLAIIIIEIWNKLANRLKLGLSGQWVGYLGMLINFATLKHDFYIPFTYDRLALTSGLLSLYFYFTEKKLFLFFNSIIALVIWPTTLLFNLVMLFIPSKIQKPKTDNPVLSALWGVGIASAVCGLFILVIYIKQIPELQRLAPAVRPLLPVSLMLVAAYLGYTQFKLAQRLLPGWSEIIPKLNEILTADFRWLYIILLLTSYFLLTRVLGDPTNPYLTPQQFAINLTYGALQRPGQSLICHAVYYGLPIILLLLFWNKVLDAVGELGLGAGIMLMAVFIQAVNNETRQMANVLPLLTLFAAIAADKVMATPKIIWSTLVLTLFISKGWLPLNYFNPYFGTPGDIYPMTNFEKSAFLLWPQQAYFMNFGPWSATPYLIIQGLILILVSYTLYRIWMIGTYKNIEKINN